MWGSVLVSTLFYGERCRKKKSTIMLKLDFFQRRMVKIGVKLKGIKAVMCFLLMWKILMMYYLIKN